MQTISSIFSFRLASRNTFSEVYHYLPKNDHEKAAGELFGVFEFLDNPGAEDALLQQITQTLHDVYYASSRKDSFERFEDALREVNAVIAREAAKRETGSLGRISACVAVMQGKIIHFAVSGEGSVYIQRSNKFSLISSPAESSEEEMSNEDTFLDIASGELQKDDMVLLSTSNILEFVGKQQVKDVLGETGSMERNVKNLKTIVKDAGMESVSLIALSMGEASAQQVMEAREVRRQAEIQAAALGTRLKETATRAIGASKRYVGVISDKASQLIAKAKPKVAPPKKNPYIFYGVLGGIAVLSIFFVLRFFNSLDDARIAEYERTFSEIESNLQIAEQRNVLGEKEDAKRFLDIAEQQLKTILSGNFQPEASRRANQLLEDIVKYRDNFDGIFRVNDAYAVANLAVKTPGIQPIGLINTKDGKNFVFEFNRLFEIVLDRVHDPLQIDEEEVVISGAEFDDNNSLVFIGRSGQVIEYKDGGFSRMVTDDPTWYKGVEIATYSRFIYILDSTEGKIWKYQRLRSKYGASQPYNPSVDLKGAVSFAIDGDIYVLMQDATIKKLRKGEEQPFNVRMSLSNPLKNPTKIFTDANMMNLYILDPENHRVVVISKDRNGVADYQRQLVFTNITDMRDLYVDSLEKKIYILTKDGIYGRDL